MKNWLVWFSFLFGSLVVQASEEIPIQIGRPEGVSSNFVTFLNAHHPGNRIGYRIHEHLPLLGGQVPHDMAETDIDSESVTQWIADFSAMPSVYRTVRNVTEEGWIPQVWVFYFAPKVDGIEILWVVETQSEGLPEYYSAQQCFRMSGKTNAEWRRKVADTTAFSEYDLWSTLEGRNQPLASLSFFRLRESWSPFPAVRKKTISRTPQGLRLEQVAGLTEIEVQTLLDPQHPADFIEDSANGLMTRTSPEGDWISGLYWERTTHLSNHHPADCLHSIVNLGPLPPNQTRAIRGKIYWMPGTPDDLLQHWRNDFPEEP